MTIPKRWRLRSLIATGLLGAVVSSVLVASSGEAAEQGGSRGHSSPEWTGSWATAVTRGNAAGLSLTGFNNQSLRMPVHTSVGGSKIRIRLSNIGGEKGVDVGAATVAKPNTATPELSDIDAGSVRQLRFNGSPTATIHQGAELLSDPVDMRLQDDQDLVVSVYFPSATGLTTWHQTAMQSNFVGAGDLAATPGGEGYTTTVNNRFFLSGVDVLRADSAGAVGVLADSLADGHGTTFNGNVRWPDQLADRLFSVRRGDVPGVLNFGLGGSRLNHEGTENGDGQFPGNFALGPNALARMNGDVFSETGLHTIILDLGINDIWMNNEPADKIINSLRQLNQQARERGVQVIIATLGPFNGLEVVGSVWSPEKEATRNAVNEYIRTHRNEFDAVLDVDKILRDPADPSKVKPEFDPGDHIHPNDAGSKAIADAVPLNLIVR